MGSLFGNILVVQIVVIVTSGYGSGMSDIHVQIAQQFCGRYGRGVIYRSYPLWSVLADMWLGWGG